VVALVRQDLRCLSDDANDMRDDRMSRTFIWRPGAGCSKDAAARLAKHFPMPREVMGEAWFMSD
jgi:hypothetical protein